MFNKILKKQTKAQLKIMVVSDIHLQLPITRELEMIQGSLVSRINELSKSRNAILVLNGDVLELWEQKDQSVEDIINGFSKLTKAIQDFVAKKGHEVVYTVGNHDDVLSHSASDRKVLEKKWSAEICRTFDLETKSKKIRFEHGHESDPYNATSLNDNPRGKRLVQKTLPILLSTMPSLFKGIGDVVNRSLLPSFVLSNLVYKIIAPICAPLIVLISIYLSAQSGDDRYWKAVIIVLVFIWATVLIVDVLMRVIAEKALGGGSGYMKKVDKYQKEAKFNTIVYGHTHQGVVEKRGGYLYANGGCNDVIALPKIGWLGLIKFNRYVQLSNLIIDTSKKYSAKYHQEIVPLVE